MGFTWLGTVPLTTGIVAQIFGPLDPLVPTLLVTGTLAATAWWNPSRVSVDLLGRLGVLAMPVLWSHSTLMMLPLVALALSLTWRERAARPREFLLAALAALLTLRFESTLVKLVAEPLQPAVVLLPLAAWAALGAYLVRYDARK